MFPRTHTLNFEADPSGQAPLGGEADPGVDPDGGEPWSGPDQETWEQIVETNTMLRQALEQAQVEQAPAEQNGQPQVQVPDPYADPEGFQAWLDSRVDERTAPVTAYQQEMEKAEGRERGMDILADIESREGEFLLPDYSRDRAYELGDRYYPEMVQRFGDTPKAAEAALARGYKEAKEHELAIGKAFHEREINQLATLSGAPRELAASGTQAAAQAEIPRGGNERDVLSRFFPT